MATTNPFNRTPARSASRTTPVRMIRTALTLPLSTILTALTLQGTPVMAQSTDADAGQNAPAKVPAQATPKPSQATQNKAKGGLTGRVLDEDGKPFAGAQVKLIHEGKSEKQLETTTDAEGKFQVQNLEPGKWKMTVLAPEMLSHTAHVDIHPDKTADREITLNPVETADVIKIKGKRTQIDPKITAVQTRIDKRYIDELGSGNNLRRLVETAPGVSRDSLGNIVTRGEHNAVNYEIDGVILPEAAGVLQQTQATSPRSIQSMEVDTGGYSAMDGGGPLGAVVKMRSLPIQAKPTLKIGTQLGGPMAGGVNYYASTALSQDPNSIWNRVRVESSGLIFGRKLGLETPAYRSRRNGRFDLNILNKLVFDATAKDRISLTAAFNETYLHQPTNVASRRAGFKVNEHDRQNYLIASYRRKFEKVIDEANIHFVSAYYSQRIGSTNVFDPAPIINGEDQQILSTAFQARRYNYTFSAQGDVRKTFRKTHHLVAGFLSEVRPVKTTYDQFTYNADPRITRESQAAQNEAVATAQSDAQAAIDQASADASGAAQAARDEAAAAASEAALNNGGTEDDAAAAAEAAANLLPSPETAAAQAASALPTPQAAGQAAAAANPVVQYGGLISPFTGTPFGPQFQGIGKYRGFRYLQSAFFQDTWKPEARWLKRFTFDAGIRFDLYHGVFGSSMPLAQTVAAIPGVGPFSLEPFLKHRVTNAQASGRYSVSYLLTKNTVLRGSCSDLFTPPPVDIFIQPFDVTEGPFPFNGIFNGAPRPMQANRGRLVDAGVQQQIGPRFSLSSNLYWKQLRNFGDSGVIANTIVYNRLTLPKQQAYGLDTRFELKPSKDGTGFYGFISNTLAVVKLQGNKLTSGGQWDQSTEFESTKYVDHDRREYMQAALGYRSKRGFWTLADVSYQTGFKNGRDPNIFGPHPARSKPIYLIGLNCGYDIPKEIRKDRRLTPSSVEVRIENLTSNVAPINLGSPFQGTRYTLPIRVLAGVNWTI